MTEIKSGAERLLHTMIRVKNLDRSLEFYCDKMGMKKLRSLDFPGARFSLVYLGYASDRDHAVLELTYNWDESEEYTHGSGYGHIGIGVNGLAGFCDALAERGVNILRPAGEMMNSGIHIAFIEDPDGYKIELIEMPFPPQNMGEQTTFE